MGVDEQPRSFAGLQWDCGVSQVYAAIFDRLRGELQPAPSPPWSSFSEPLQIDDLRRRQLFHGAGALHPLKSVKSGVGKGFEATGEISLLRPWNNLGNAIKRLARPRQRVGPI